MSHVTHTNTHMCSAVFDAANKARSAAANARALVDQTVKLVDEVCDTYTLARTHTHT